jgi:hypothetical protein
MDKNEGKVFRVVDKLLRIQEGERLVINLWFFCPVQFTAPGNLFLAVFLISSQFHSQMRYSHEGSAAACLGSGAMNLSKFLKSVRLRAP